MSQSLPEEIPLNTNHPAVREYLSLIRLQVLTPLSLLIAIATIGITTFIIHPGLGTISKLHPTPITPSPIPVGVYLLAIFAGQIGYCVFLVLASKPETKQALVKGSGLSLVVANWVLAAWAVAWSLQFFLASTVFLAILTLTLLYSNLVLLIYHKPTRSRPLDMLFIHTPVRLFLLLPATLLLPQSTFITSGKTWPPTHYELYKSYQWSGFAAVLVTNFIGLLVVTIRRDVVWCIAAVWINVCILIERPKSTPVKATVILFTVLLPISLVAVTVWRFLISNQRREGVIALPPDEGHAARTPSVQHDHEENVGRVWH